MAIKLNTGKISKVFIISLSLIIIIIFILCVYCNHGLYYELHDFEDDLLEKYFNAQHNHNVPWYYISSYFILKGADSPSDTEIKKTALKIRKILDEKRGLEEFIEKYNLRGFGLEVFRHNAIDDILKDKVFPIDTNADYKYDNDWHYPRTFGGDRKHEGTDIFCQKGTAVRTVSDGKITRLGWNTLGGWRVGIRYKRNIYFYYAHLCCYEDGIFEGMTVKKGQIIGYVGDSGYGAEGTTGKFQPHLHFGIYQKDKAYNPYPFLIMWE
ncbi:MAG TPA: M23 family metallopeptidase [Clostridiales bacterium]|nr:M23 family metallopeptidase [Clostridiales bacterium]